MITLYRFIAFQSVLLWRLVCTVSGGGDIVVCQLHFPKKTHCCLWLSKRAHSGVSRLGRADGAHVWLVSSRWVLLV